MTSNNTKSTITPGQDGVVLQGYHKKLKTMKKKYFVLCAESGSSSARLEYYDSEKKFKSRSNPKKTIILKNCFNINRRLDTKHKFVIALSTKEEGFCIVLDSEQELNKWLRALLALQRGEDAESDPPKPTFEHVWQVQVQRKGLAEEKGIIGSYHVCLTSKSLTLVRIGPPNTNFAEARLYSVEFFLTTIRRCGHSQCYFYMEVGRHSAVGAGELWMETEDALIAESMHTMIINASKFREDTFGPMRKRSSSANEASKPISVLHRRQTHSGNKPMNSSPLSESPSATSSAVSSASTIIQTPITKPTTSKTLEKCHVHGATSNSNSTSNQPNDINHRAALSASSCCSSTRATPVIINTSYNPQYPFAAPLRPLGSQRRHSVSGTILGRERCDSLPSRNRTASECSNQSITNPMMPPPKTVALSNRPHSMYNNRHSHSPPMNTLSPSTGCSESDGSSHSIDETDSFGHSLTPDESGNFFSRYYNSCTSGSSVIPEENSDDYWYQDNKKSSRQNNTSMDKLNNHPSGLSLPISNQNAIRKGSPASQIGSAETQSQYMDMYSPYSPCGSSPCDQTGSGYIPISPSAEPSRGFYAGSSGGHSRASSFAEETVDGYVPMLPPQSQDYVDMEQSTKTQNFSELSSAASSCSITSGTPSTDLRFAEYPLDKVKSRFTPDDEDLQPASDRPIRAYSVGSRLEHNKRKLRVDVLNAEQNNSRVRAFSVGSRAKVPRSDLYRGAFASNFPSFHTNNNNLDTLTTVKNKKSSSAPILVHKSQSSVDRMDDLMEIDFSKNSEQSNTPSPIRYSSFPVAVPARPVYDPHASSPKTVSFPGYVEMKPGSPAEKSSPIDSVKTSDSGYLEMKPVCLSSSPSLSSSPFKTMSSPKLISQRRNSTEYANESEYINVSPSNKSTSSVPLEIANAEEYSNSMNEQQMNVDHFPVISSTPEGYMQMSFGKSAERLSSNKYGSENSTWEKRSVSKPIDIKTKETSSDGMFSIKRFRSDSKESDTVTVPGAQTTIFPFSPSSPPVKPLEEDDFIQRKCLVDATNGMITIPQNTRPVVKITNAVNQSVEKNVDSNYKILNVDIRKDETTTKEVDVLASDYAVMSLGNNNGKKQSTDYVDYEPLNTRAQNKEAKVDEGSSSHESDYAVMNPSKRSQIGTVIASTLTTTANAKKYVPIALGNKIKSNCFEGFKPISSKNDELLLNADADSKKTSMLSKPTTYSQFSRQLSERGKKEDNSGYELLHMSSDSSLPIKKMSRPNSVNSDKISPLKATGRPNSANSEYILSISTSSSTSTLCGGSSSSSSTLCGSKSQSPLANSRPQSFSDSTVASRPESMGSLVDQSVSSRPPSVSSERELHYASLDLPTTAACVVNSGAMDSSGSQHPSSSSSTAKGSSSVSGESSTSPSPNAGTCQQQPTFTYAQIDFNKSENFKLATNAGKNSRRSRPSWGLND